MKKNIDKWTHRTRSKSPAATTASKSSSHSVAGHMGPRPRSRSGSELRAEDKVNLIANPIAISAGDDPTIHQVFSSSGSSSEKQSHTSTSRRSYKLSNPAALLATLCKLSFVISVLLTLGWFHVRLSQLEIDLSSLSGSGTQQQPCGHHYEFAEVDPRSQSSSAAAVSSSNIKHDVIGTHFNEFEVDVDDDDDGERVGDGDVDSGNKTTSKRRVKRRVDHRHSDGGGRNERGTRQHKRSKSQAHVEFVHPKHREEMEANRRDDSDSTRSGLDPGADSGGDGLGPGSDPDWVWLTSYSRIPVQAFEEFCAGTQKYCPPSPPGPEGKSGRSGPKGEKGDQGFSGERGPVGLQGLPGYPGLRGAAGPTGLPGQPGSDGRDGLPGEPGLDGIPGRNGLDGIPGLPGTTGLPGVSGRNGTDGIPGKDGERGPPGPTGTTGLPGMKGWPGAKGEKGRDGLPGTIACELNCSTASRGPTQGLIIPPSILGSEIGTLRPLIVREGDNVRLRCSATGFPRPGIGWRREDSRFTAGGEWSVSDVNGPILNLTSVNRRHMGKYICLANNGINPPASRVYDIQVHFPPFIRILTPEVFVHLSQPATLDCFVEAYPHGITYWETADLKLLSNSDKYRMTTNVTDIYKIRMTLTITRTTHSDLRLYLCVCKNEFKTVKGKVRLNEVDGSLPTRPPYEVGPTGPSQTYGKEPPALVDFPDECPPPAPPTTCTTCPPRVETKCNAGVFHLLDYTHFDITNLGVFTRPINDTDPQKRNSSVGCLLSAVGKPVYHGVSNFNGSWMRETVSNHSDYADKYWVTNMNERHKLYEYHNKTMFTLAGAGGVGKIYTLRQPFQDNSHVVYNGSLFYVKEHNKSRPDEKPTIVRFKLDGSGIPMQQIELPYASFKARRLYRYNEKRNWTWVDLAVDENGLWAIHSLENSENLAVVKIDWNEYINIYEITYGWNIEIFHKNAGDMFIICGIIYAVDDVDIVETKIRLAFDLYQESVLKIDLPFTNPFSDTVMVSYNPRTKELFTWDKGNQLIYPIKQIGLHSAASPEDRKHSFAESNI